MDESFLNGRVLLHPGDCLDVLARLAECSVDSCVTDPPYHLTSIVKRFANASAEREQYAATSNSAYMSRGFMGKQWDGGDIAFDAATWRAVYRVLKPGGHLLAMGGTRTFHRLACAIEDAGFEIRDTISWNFGSGFPKSHDIGKKLDGSQARCSCARVRDMRHASASSAVADKENESDVLQLFMQEQDICGSPAALRSELLGEETAEQSIEGITQPGMEGRRNIPETSRELRERALREMPAGVDFDGESGRLRDGAPSSDGADSQAPIASNGMRPSSRSPTAEQRADQFGIMAVQSQPQERGAWPHCEWCGKPIVPDGLGTALKPAMELICLARKPLSEGTVAANVLRWGTGTINVDGCRVGTETTITHLPKGNGLGSYTNDGANRMQREAHEYENPPGRWPANVAHDGSDEVTAAFPDGRSAGDYPSDGAQPGDGWGNIGKQQGQLYSDTGSAARFFYTAKADADDRLGSKHPTVKPLDLMQWLVRLVTPRGGVVLDPFAGTGTTGEAAWREGAHAVLIEAEAEYQADIRRRMALALAGPDERSRESIKARNLPRDDGPLFALPEAAE